MGVANEYCYNITTPITLSLTEGARPYYTFSLKIRDKTIEDAWPEDFVLSDTADWLNIVYTVNYGCAFVLTPGNCHQDFLDIWVYCAPALRTVGFDTHWFQGGMLNDTCGQFYITAGAELKGYLWDFPLSDVTFDAGWQ